MKYSHKLAFVHLTGRVNVEAHNSGDMKTLSKTNYTIMGNNCQQLHHPLFGFIIGRI